MSLGRSLRFVLAARRYDPFAIRRYSDACGDANARKGLVLGAYDGCNAGEYKLTATAEKFDGANGNKLNDLLKGSGLKLGKSMMVNNLGEEFFAVAVVGLGPEGVSFNENEQLNENKENSRIAAAVGARALQDACVANIMVEEMSCAEAAAEGAALAVWKFDMFKNKADRITNSTVDLYDGSDREGWDKGICKAESQNIARLLSDTPANIMTPSEFAAKAIEILCPCGVQVNVRDDEWMEGKKMQALLAMGRGGSCEPPLMLELAYCGGSQEDKPVILVGKGVTFDSGGLCLRPVEGMPEYRADMAGAAVIVGAMKCLATIGSPINVNALIPLCENMPGGKAKKPGDVLFGLNGKSIRIQDTSNEGRVILADALAYSNNYKPCLVVNVATLTQTMREALGASSSGAFTTSDIVWKELCRAGAETGDRVWRFPLWRYYSNKVTDFASVDTCNVALGRGGHPCTGAAFLMEFVPPVDFLHLDITGTGMLSTGIGFPYLRAGTMTGRPTRTLFQFLHQIACPEEKSTC